MNGATYFSTFDLVSGYWQIEIEEDSRKYTAFLSDEGKFEFNVMPFGLTNAPSAFQRTMEDVFDVARFHFLLVYLDDIIIFSKTWEEHKEHIRFVLNRLRQYGFKAKITKCSFACSEISYLGHILNKDGIAPNPAKINAINDIPFPETFGQLHSFLSMINYFRNFISQFSTIIAFLYSLLSSIIAWGLDRQQAYKFFKEKLCSASILVHPDFY